MQVHSCIYRTTYSEMSFACKTWKSQNWEELGTISKTSSSPHLHNRCYTSTLWEGKLSPEGRNDLSKVSRSPVVTPYEFSVDLEFPWGLSPRSDHKQKQPLTWGCSLPTSAKGIPSLPRTYKTFQLHLFGERQRPNIKRSWCEGCEPWLPHTCIYTYTRYTYIRIHTHTHACAHIYTIHTYTRIYTCAHTYKTHSTHIYTHIHLYIYNILIYNMHMSVYTWAMHNTCVHIHKYTIYMCTHMHIHTQPLCSLTRMWFQLPTLPGFRALPTQLPSLAEATLANEC